MISNNNRFVGLNMVNSSFTSSPMSRSNGKFENTPLETFFSALENTDSLDSALAAMKLHLVKRKLDFTDKVEDIYEEEFEEIWKLKQKERILSKIVK